MLAESDLQTTTERRLWTAIETGDLVDAKEEPEDQRAVRAELIAELLTADRSASGRRPRALWLASAHIAGELDLSGLTLACPLGIADSDFDDPVWIDNTQMPSLSLTACRLPALSADQLETRGDVRLDKLEADTVVLLGARIGGALSLNDATLRGAEGLTLFGDGLDVRGALMLNRLHADGELSLIGARIGGQLSLRGAQLNNEGGEALSMDGITIGAGGIFAQELHAIGGVRMPGATLGGQLQLQHAVLEREDGIALLGDSLTANSLKASGLHVKGQVHLLSARFAVDVILYGATLTSTANQTLVADNVDVGTNVFCADGFSITGGFRLDRAHIGVSLGFRDASLINPGGRALDAANADIGQNVFLGPGLSVEGSLHLSSARVDGAIELLGSTLADPGRLVLTDARVRTFADYEWPSAPEKQAERPYEPHLNGFLYDHLQEGTDAVASRLDWIAHAEQPYLPHAYDRLASAYRAAGREEDARAVMIAKERRKRGQLHLPGQLWSWFLDLTVGFGYHTGRAVFGLLLVMLAGWPVFAWASWGHLTELKSHTQMPQFEPWLYSMDAVLPVITFGQETAWGPTGFALYWYVFSVLSGWILGTALIAALTSMLNRG
jgi:hypothetical protein